MAIRVSCNRRGLAVVAGFLVMVSSALPALAQQYEPIWPKFDPKLLETVPTGDVVDPRCNPSDLAAVVMRDSAMIVNQVRTTKRSPIMDHSMTDRDRKDPMAVLPPACVDLDRPFHLTAAKLTAPKQAAASERNNRAQVQAFLNKMTETCSTCHWTFATDRLPGFAGK